MSTYDFDYFVIGGGSGGVRSARIAASLGAKVGIAESKHLGGTCVNVGCVPKKLMIYAADYAAEFEDAKGYGWSIPGEPKFNWNHFIERKNNEIERLNGIYQNLLDTNKVQVFHDHAMFLDPHTLKIGNKTVTAEKILIATGGQPRPPSVDGGEHTITSDEIFYLDKQPDHLLIIGGGYIGVEFAHIFAGMGTKVTLCHRGATLLRTFDHDLSEHLIEEMKKQGITIGLHCNLEEIGKKVNGKLEARMSNGDMIECDQILNATGRIPNTQGLGLNNINLELEDTGQIKINDDYQTSIPHIYALGDVTNTLQLTPVAISEGQELARRLFGNTSPKKDYLKTVATAIFSRPPIGTIGLSEHDARQQGYDIEVYKTNFRSMKYILAGRDERTFMKLIVDKKTDRVIGCHMIGQDAGEIMQGFSVAMNCGATKADFDRTIGIHPTSAEEFVTMK